MLIIEGIDVVEPGKKKFGCPWAGRMVFYGIIRRVLLSPNDRSCGDPFTTWSPSSESSAKKSLSYDNGEPI